MELPEEFIILSTRYVLGRKTYLVGEHVKWLLDNWHRIPEATRKQIVKDIEYHFAQGDVGMDIDEKEGEKVRKLYKS